MAAIIRLYSTSKTPLDGVSVLSAAYFQGAPGIPAPGQFDVNQSTIVLVPTFACQTSIGLIHKPAWEINEALYHQFVEPNMKEKMVPVKKLAYNHGELCPNSCGDPTEY